MRDHGALQREAFDVLGFLRQERERDQEREVRILVAGVLEAPIEVGLHLLPHRVAVRLDHHATLDDLGRLGQAAFTNDVLVPLRVVLGSGCDARFRHEGVLPVVSLGGPAAGL